MKKVKLFMALSVLAVTVSVHAQETVGGLVCGQTYDYDYIISVLGEPDYVSIMCLMTCTSFLCTRRSVRSLNPRPW